MPWFNNQYFDPKKKKWKTGKYLNKTRRRHTLLWTFVIFIILSLVVTLVLDYFFPGIRIFFIGA